MKLEFTSNYEIGVPHIDAEHRGFFDYLNSAMAALDEPDEAAGIAMARNILLKLEDYANTHFAHEEAYMEETGDAQLFAQIREHQAFRSSLANLLAKRSSLTHKDLGDIFVFMAKWLRNHILCSDMLIGAARSQSGKYEMTDEFMIGVPLIDDEHATLFATLGTIHETIADDLMHDRFDSIVEIMMKLKDYTAKHFIDEEAYMESIDYDGLPAQKAAHEAFIDKLNGLDLTALSDATHEEQREYLDGLVEFLNDWLVNHILRMDKEIPAR